MEGFVEWTFEGDLKRSRSHGFRYAEAINAGNIFLIWFIEKVSPGTEPVTNSAHMKVCDRADR